MFINGLLGIGLFLHKKLPLQVQLHPPQSQEFLGGKYIRKTFLAGILFFPSPLNDWLLLMIATNFGWLTLS